jgi:3D (Asp-Asp-Asp) domain-containing protein
MMKRTDNISAVLTNGGRVLLAVVLAALFCWAITASSQPQPNHTPRQMPMLRTTNTQQAVDTPIVKPSDSTEDPAPQYRTVRMRVTAYCACRKCCGKYSDGITASGHKIRRGDTFIAADKRHRFGTEMVIPGYANDKPVKVLDRGGAIHGNRLDVFFDSHREAKKWGVQYLDVEVSL